MDDVKTRISFVYKFPESLFKRLAGAVAGFLSKRMCGMIGHVISSLLASGQTGGCYEQRSGVLFPSLIIPQNTSGVK